MGLLDGDSSEVEFVRLLDRDSSEVAFVGLLDGNSSEVPCSGSSFIGSSGTETFSMNSSILKSSYMSSSLVGLREGDPTFILIFHQSTQLCNGELVTWCQLGEHMPNCACLAWDSSTHETCSHLSD